MGDNEERLKEFAATLVGLLQQLHEVFAWEGLSHSIEDIESEAVELDVISEDELGE